MGIVNEWSFANDLLAVFFFFLPFSFSFLWLTKLAYDFDFEAGILFYSLLSFGLAGWLGCKAVFFFLPPVGEWLYLTKL